MCLRAACGGNSPVLAQGRQEAGCHQQALDFVVQSPLLPLEEAGRAVTGWSGSENTPVKGNDATRFWANLKKKTQIKEPHETE